MRHALIAAVALAFFAVAPAWADTAVNGHGIAMHGLPKYKADFKHFDYVNPQAPKAGEVN